MFFSIHILSKAIYKQREMILQRRTIAERSIELQKTRSMLTAHQKPIDI